MIESKHLKELLRPDVSFELETTVSGPLDLLRLKDQLDRMRLDRDEPDSKSTITLSIQFKPRTWEALERLTKQLTARGAQATPEEIASLLVERSLDETTREA